MVIQINGKTRDVLSVKNNLNEIEIKKLVKESLKANKYLVDKVIKKTIFVKNKIINFIVQN